ncbi:hypothetical protein HDE_12961 [Halotydeus destructor]|nr:hypothetical protein HDE_12961 [Halotydeus destructor]
MIPVVVALSRNWDELQLAFWCQPEDLQEAETVVSQIIETEGQYHTIIELVVRSERDVIHGELINGIIAVRVVPVANSEYCSGNLRIESARADLNAFSKLARMAVLKDVLESKTSHLKTVITACRKVALASSYIAGLLRMVDRTISTLDVPQTSCAVCAPFQSSNPSSLLSIAQDVDRTGHVDSSCQRSLLCSSVEANHEPQTGMLQNPRSFAESLRRFNSETRRGIILLLGQMSDSSPADENHPQGPATVELVAPSSRSLKAEKQSKHSCNLEALKSLESKFEETTAASISGHYEETGLTLTNLQEEGWDQFQRKHPGENLVWLRDNSRQQSRPKATTFQEKKARRKESHRKCRIRIRIREKAEKALVKQRIEYLRRFIKEAEEQSDISHDGI